MPRSAVASLRQETVERLKDVRAFKQVFDARQPQIKREFLPCVRVYTAQAMEGLADSAMPIFRSTTTLTIAITAEDITDARNAALVDDLCEAVRERLMGDVNWLRLFERIVSIDTTVDRNVEGEWRSTSATMTFALQCTEAYDIDWDAPYNHGGDLEKIHLDIDVIDPAADPNTGPPGTPPNVEGGYRGGHPGPEGRIEAAVEISVKE